MIIIIINVLLKVLGNAFNKCLYNGSWLCSIVTLKMLCGNIWKRVSFFPDWQCRSPRRCGWSVWILKIIKPCSVNYNWDFTKIIRDEVSHPRILSQFFLEEKNPVSTPHCLPFSLCAGLMDEVPNIFVHQENKRFHKSSRIVLSPSQSVYSNGSEVCAFIK